MEGLLERAWNHPPLDKCLELVEDSTERSTTGVTERWARGFLLLRLTECTKKGMQETCACTHCRSCPAPDCKWECAHDHAYSWLADRWFTKTQCLARVYAQAYANTNRLMHTCL